MTEPGTTEHEELLSEYVDLWNGDFSKIDAASESISIREAAVPDGLIQGQSALKARIREVHTGFPDFENTVDDALIDEDTIMLEWTMSGTHEGEYGGIPPSHREMEIKGMTKLLIADEKVQEGRMYYSVQELLAQLGLSEE